MGLLGGPGPYTEAELPQATRYVAGDMKPPVLVGDDQSSQEEKALPVRVVSSTIPASCSASGGNAYLLKVAGGMSCFSPRLGASGEPLPKHVRSTQGC